MGEGKTHFANVLESCEIKLHTKWHAHEELLGGKENIFKKLRIPGKYYITKKLINLAV